MPATSPRFNSICRAGSCWDDYVKSARCPLFSMSNDSHPWRSGLKWYIPFGLIVRLLTAVAMEQEFGWNSCHSPFLHACPTINFKNYSTEPCYGWFGPDPKSFQDNRKSCKSSGLRSLGAVDKKLSLCEFLIWVSQTISWEEHTNQDLLDICLPLSCSDLMPPKAELSLTALQLGDAGKGGESCWM